MWNECGRFVGTKQHGDVQATFGCWFLNFVLIVPLGMMNLNTFKGLFVAGKMKVAIKNLGFQILVGKWHINSQGSLAKPCSRRSLNLRQRPTMWHHRMPSNELLPRWLSFVPSHVFFFFKGPQWPSYDVRFWPMAMLSQKTAWTLDPEILPQKDGEISSCRFWFFCCPCSILFRFDFFLFLHVSPARWQTQWQTIPNRGFWNCVSP